MTSSPDAAPRPLGPVLEFLQRIWELNHALEQLSVNMAMRLGITAQQRFIIRFIERYPGLPAGQLASLLHLDPGTISAGLRRLEAKGLVERTRDPHDQRRSSIRLTAKGRDLARPGPGTVEHAVKKVLRSADAQDIEAAAQVLGQLTRHLSGEVVA